MKAGTGACLHLVPVPIGMPSQEASRPAWTAAEVERVLCPGTLAQLRRTRYFLVESARSARALLKAAGHPEPLSSLQIVEIGHAPRAELLDAWLDPVQGRGGSDPIDAAVLSEAGAPGIADPGSSLVARAHERGIRVVPWVGPSSIALALMGSGMNGQQFRFLGYLPQEREELRRRIAAVQADARQGETQIFIETPYRNERLFEALLQQCDPSLRLCLAIDLTGPAEALQTRTIAQWRALAAPQRPALARRPAVFLLQGSADPGGGRAHKSRG
jgi:16S rRNA (cytidine1402-2'-O)-methyltransferase